MTKIMLIRHGETEWNELGLYQGQRNSPLTVQGREQAEALAERLSKIPIDEFYSSDSGRAQETAAPLVKITNITLQLDPRIRERDYGIFQGLNKEKVPTIHPKSYAQYKKGDPDFVIPDGESMRQFHKRISQFLDDLAVRHEGKSIVVITHGGTIASIVYQVLGLSLTAERHFTIANTSYNEIRRDEDGWKLTVLGDTSHLSRLSSDDVI